MHYCINSLLEINNEIMQYCIIIINDIALIMHYCALLKGSGCVVGCTIQSPMTLKILARSITVHLRYDLSI